MYKILSGNKKGILLVEVAIVVTVITIALIGLLTLTVFSLKVSNLVKETNIANNLARESLEAVRNFRDGTDWTTDGLGILTIGALYHPELNSNIPPAWEINGGAETINGFSRNLVFELVSRDPVSDSIEAVYNPANLDPDTLKVISTVSWKSNEIRLINYLTNFK